MRAARRTRRSRPEHKWRQEHEFEHDSSYKVSEVPSLPAGTYVVSIQRQSNFRRLHIVGSCPSRAGIDFAHFEAFGTTQPEDKHYTACCKHCLKTGMDAGAVEGSTDASTDTIGSSFDSSS